MKIFKLHIFKRVLLCFISAFMAFIILFPVVITLSYSLMGKNETAAFMAGVESSTTGFIPIKLIPEKFSIHSYYEILIESTRFNVGYWNSLIYAFAITIGQLIVGTGAAFVFSKFRFKCRNALFFVYIAIMMMPFQVTLVPNYIAIRTLNILDTGFAVVLPGIFSAFGVFILRQFMLNISDSIIEASQIDGAGTYVIFSKIMLPLSKTGLISLFVLSFLDTWNMVEQPLIFIKDINKMPLSILIRTAMDRGNESVLTPAVLYMIPAILIYFIFKDSLVEGISKSWLGAAAEGRKLAVKVKKVKKEIKEVRKINASKIYLVIALVYFALMGFLYFVGPSLTRLLSPEVTTAQFSGSYMGDRTNYYKYTISLEAIRHEEDGESFIYIMRRKRSFWVEGDYSVKIKVDVLVSDDRKAAIEPIDTINSMDYPIVSSSKKLKDGGRVFKK